MTIEHGVGGAERRPFFSRMPLDAPIARDVPELPVPSVLASKYVNAEDELYIGEWTFLCPKTILHRHKETVRSGQTRAIDLAFRYLGMGHVSIMSYDPQTQSVFERRDGGSNDVERHLRWQEKVSLDVDGQKKQPFATWWVALTGEAIKCA